MQCNDVTVTVFTFKRTGWVINLDEVTPEI